MGEAQDSLDMNNTGPSCASAPAAPSPATRRLAADEAGLREAAGILRAGGLVAIPTETVYGLAADATHPQAVARIYAAKGRPVFNPLIVHFPDAEAALSEGLFNTHALSLARLFWPGPLTLVVPVTGSTLCCELARAGLDTVALRVPSHPVAQALMRLTGFPLAAPSANRSGHVSPTTAGHVLADLDGRIEAVLDAGPCETGIESTIVACLGQAPVLLRAGGVTRLEIEAALGCRLASATEGSAASPLAPGMLSSHYSPRARLRLNAVSPEKGEAWLGFGNAGPLPSATSRNLSPGGNLTEAAANLYRFLRELDLLDLPGIAVASLPRHGIGEAINDRLNRAAAPKV